MLEKNYKILNYTILVIKDYNAYKNGIKTKKIEIIPIKIYKPTLSS